MHNSAKKIKQPLGGWGRAYLDTHSADFHSAEGSVILLLTRSLGMLSISNSTRMHCNTMQDHHFRKFGQLNTLWDVSVRRMMSPSPKWGERKLWKSISYITLHLAHPQIFVDLLNKCLVTELQVMQHPQAILELNTTCKNIVILKIWSNEKSTRAARTTHYKSTDICTSFRTSQGHPEVFSLSLGQSVSTFSKEEPLK